MSQPNSCAELAVGVPGLSWTKACDKERFYCYSDLSIPILTSVTDIVIDGKRQQDCHQGGQSRRSPADGGLVAAWAAQNATWSCCI